MKPYLESVRKLSRVGLILFAMSVIASIVVAIQISTAQYRSDVPSMSQMFIPLIAFIYAGGLVFALEGFSFLLKRSDSDFYHSLPVSRQKLYWAITLAALTWIAATVLGSVLFSVIVFTITKTPFVPLYSLIAVPFFTVAAMLVFAACAIAMSLTGTMITTLGITVLVFGLLRFVQFSVARGIIANAQIIGWLDLPWYLSPVTNIATGQIAQIMRPMLRATLYQPVNIIYSALIAGGELALGSFLFARRPSELAERGAKNSGVQTAFACAAVVPVVMLFAAGVIRKSNPIIPIVIGAAISIYVIYQIIVLRSAKKVLLSLPWLLVPLAIGFAGYYGTDSAYKAMQSYVPNSQDVAYIQFGGQNRGSESISYQQYMVSKVKFSEQEMRNYALDTLRDNVATIRNAGYLNYPYDAKQGYMPTNEPVTFVLKNGKTFSRVLTFTNQNTLESYREQNSDFLTAIRSVPPLSAVCYLQGNDPYKEGYQASKEILTELYGELAAMNYPASDSYRIYDPDAVYDIGENQNMGSISSSGYIGMTRFNDYYNIRVGMPKTASAWMAYQNSISKGEYLDIMQQMMEKSASMTNDTDYFNLSMTLYNVPMSDGTERSISFYFDRSPYDDAVDMKDQMQPLMNELAKILLRSTPTIDPNGFCVFANWGGRVHNDDGTFIGADVLAQQLVTRSDGSFVSGGSVYYVSDGRTIYSGVSGGITSYNPCYRAFTPEDQARVIEILQQWEEIQEQYNITRYGSQPNEGPSIGAATVLPEADTVPAG